MADESSRTAAWLYTKLNADSAITTITGAGGIYDSLAPQGATWPNIVFQQQAPHDVLTAAGNERVMTSDLWLVRGIARQESYAGVLGTLADRIDANLHRAAGGAAGADGVVFTAVRLETFRSTEDDDGVQYRHLGGLFRIYTQVP